jgi:anti-sigma regulatory factor (Ser/Thr protein kinase)
VRSPLPPTEASLSAARNCARSVCREHGLEGDRCDSAVLVLSELLTNALRYGMCPISYAIEVRDGQVLVVVSDGALAEPVLSHAEVDAESGRGMRIVDEVSSDWGSFVADGHKQVWALL